jgi:uncharacterized protein YaaW (UPF0174 family)
MTDINERVAIVETEVKNLTEKVDDLKQTVHDNHEQLQEQLKTMAENSTSQHGLLADKVVAIERTLHGWVMWVLGASAIISAIIGIYNLIK